MLLNDLQPVFAPEIALEGFWSARLSGYESSVLQIDPAHEGGFLLSFYHSSCTGRDQWQIASCSNHGVLDLNAGGKAIDPRVWVLYPCRVAGEECLVPGALGELRLGWQDHVYRRAVIDDPKGFRERWLEGGPWWLEIAESGDRH